MKLIWQENLDPVNWIGCPYWWCHGCNQPKQSGMLISSEKDPERWLRLCLNCIDLLNRRDVK